MAEAQDKEKPSSDGEASPDAPATPGARRGRASQVTANSGAKGERRRFLRQYARWLWPYKWVLLVVFLLALVSATMDMVWPLAIKRVIDDVLLAGGVDNAEKFRRLNVFGGAIVGLLVLKEIVETYRGYRVAAELQGRLPPPEALRPAPRPAAGKARGDEVRRHRVAAQR